jgi:vancomycin resistance protein VanJ
MKPRARHAARWLRRAVLVLAVLYPVALLGVAAALHFIGEAWPITGVALYLPRIGFAVPLPFIAVALALLRLWRFLWIQLASGLVLLFTFMGLVLPWPHFADRNVPTLRVLSYNINSCYRGVDKIAEEIDRYSPDIAFLQEIGEPEPIARAMRARYPTVEVSNQFLVASRYPISSASEPDKLPYDGRMRSPRFAQQAVETPLGRIAFYNVHPISPRDAFMTLRGHGLSREIPSGRLFSSANALAIRDNFGLRELQVQAFAEAAARETIPVVIAGDTNLPGLSQVFGRYLSPYRDAFSDVGWGFGYTFPNEKHRPWMRIDRILASAPLLFVRFQTGQSAASDHMCVVADLQRGKP